MKAINELTARLMRLPRKRKAHWSFDTSRIAGCGKVKFIPAKKKKGTKINGTRKRIKLRVQRPRVPSAQRNWWMRIDREGNPLPNRHGRSLRDADVRTMRRRRARERAVQRRRRPLIDFRKGDRVMFNPQRDGYPTAIDGTVLKVRRYFDARAQEFLVRLTVAPTADVACGIKQWSLIVPRVAVQKL